MLRGNALAKVDEKGRLKLPAAFRAHIEPRYGTAFFITSLRGESARIYPMEIWVRIEERLALVSSLNPSVLRFKRAVSYYGQNAVMDGQGRVLIHPVLRDSAGILGEVAVLGQQDHLEVWNRASFKKRMDADPLTDEDLGVLAELGV